MNDIHHYTDWFVQHHALTFVIMFFVAASESLIVVGLIVPGAAVMVAAGVLIGLNALPYWPIMLVTVLGAIVGDSLSFWVGHYYKERLRTIWPFSTHPHWLPRVEDFFHLHGGKSILIGRFVGPVRPFIPAVAGMLGMNPFKFYLVNVSSAIAWSPAYLLPGMAFGASLAMASLVATRLVMMIVIVVSAAVLILWLSKRLYNFAAPRLSNLISRLSAWAIRHPVVGKSVRSVMDIQQPVLKPLLFLGLLTLTSAALFLWLLHHVLMPVQNVGFDQGLYQLLQSLRTPWGDHVMIVITEMGSGKVLGVFIAITIIWLLWHRCWKVSLYWLAAIGFGKLASLLFKLDVHRPRPFTGLHDGLTAFSFPSAHATMSMVTYGFIAVLIAHKALPRLRWLYYALPLLMVSLIAISRIYLGAHWFSDVVAGMSLGAFWIGLLAIAYFQHGDNHPIPGNFLKFILSVFALVLLWHLTFHFDKAVKKYVPNQQVISISQQQWLHDGWRKITPYRVDLDQDSKQAINIQWQGGLQSIETYLNTMGWHRSPRLTFSSALRWLAPDYALSQLPVLPQLNAGQPDKLIMTNQWKTDNGSHTAIIRLWSTHTVIGPNNVPLWTGTIDYEMKRRVLLLALPQNAGRTNEALDQFETQLKSQLSYTQKTGTQGRLLLIQPDPAN